VVANVSWSGLKTQSGLVAYISYCNGQTVDNPVAEEDYSPVGTTSGSTVFDFENLPGPATCELLIYGEGHGAGHGAYVIVSVTF
jgi:hypothetical protein